MNTINNYYSCSIDVVNKDCKMQESKTLEEASEGYSQDTSFQQSQNKRQGRWTPDEDEQLKKIVEAHGERQWRKIAAQMNGRTSIQCLHRWTKILKPGLIKGPWTQEEDEKLIQWVKMESATKWAQCANFIQGRSGKQCRERWFNNLNPNVKKGNWTEQEDDEIFRLYLLYGSSWSKIAKSLPGRTENSIKNRFYSTVRKIAADKKKFMYNQQGLSEIKFEENIHQLIENHLSTQNRQLLDNLNETASDNISRSLSLSENFDLNQISLDNLESQFCLQKQVKIDDDSLKSQQNQKQSQKQKVTKQKKQQKSTSKKSQKQNDKLVQKLSKLQKLNIFDAESKKFNTTLGISFDKLSEDKQQNILDYDQLTEDNSNCADEEEENEVQFESLLQNIQKTLTSELSSKQSNSEKLKLNNNDLLDIQQQIFNFCYNNVEEIKQSELKDIQDFQNNLFQNQIANPSNQNFQSIEPDSLFVQRPEFNLFDNIEPFDNNSLKYSYQQQQLQQQQQFLQQQQLQYQQQQSLYKNNQYQQLEPQQNLQFQQGDLLYQKQFQQYNQLEQQSAYENNAENEKMAFLLQQLNQLENMLSSTRRELLKLESSYQEQNLNGSEGLKQNLQKNKDEMVEGATENIQNNNNNNNVNVYLDLSQYMGTPYQQDFHGQLQFDSRDFEAFTKERKDSFDHTFNLNIDFPVKKNFSLNPNGFLFNENNAFDIVEDQIPTFLEYQNPQLI